MYYIPKKLLVCFLCTILFHGVKSQTNKPNGSARPSATAINLPPGYNSGILVNYVRTREAVAPISDLSSFQSAAHTQVKQATQYLDGLGRPVQTVIKQGSPLLKDVVNPVVYDAFGREAYQYLPYIATTDHGQFKLNPFGEQACFMNSQYAGESVFYGETRFEASPLNRVTKTLAAGNSWGGSDRGVSKEYRLNDANDSVRIWNISNQALTFNNNDVTTNIPTSSAIYGNGQLFEGHTIDEANNKVVEYKDKEGKIVLKKVQIVGPPSEDHSGWLCTYYVYDDFGLLRFVIQPEAVAYMDAHDWVLNTDAINEQSFRYEYDGFQRMIAKKVPGAGWVYMVYDKRDRLAFTQDANMRISNQWMTTLYDTQNRPVATGMITYTGNRNDLQTLLDQQFDAAQSTTVTVNFNTPDILYLSVHTNGQDIYRAISEIHFNDGFDSNNESFETIIGPSPESSSTILQHYNPFPPNSNFVGLTHTYYDDYSFTQKNYITSYHSQIDDGGNAYPETLPSTPSSLTRGYVTGTRVRVLKNPADLNQGEWLEAVNFYDDKGRVIQSQTANYQKGNDIHTQRYDFTGKLITNYHVHTNALAGQSVRVKTNYLYDHAGRLLETKKTINDRSDSSRLLARNTYGELGQLKEKKLGQHIDQSLELELQKYDYNIRGWLQGLNKGYSSASNQLHWFGMELSYDYGFETNQFNGNIAGIQWRSKGDEVQRAYGYGYDKANRLLYGDFNQYSGGWNKSDNLDFSMKMGDGINTNTAYDANGNIKAMKQMGVKLNNSRVIDDLSYGYHSLSNRLAYVSDTVAVDQKLGDFTNKNLGLDDYSYDGNGNLIVDKNKSINSIKYNHLNLPYEILVNGKDTIQYIYDALGVKLEKRTAETGAHAKTTVTAYSGSFLYENNVLQLLSHEEGRIRKDKYGNYVYDYFIKDHLGNTRVVLTDERDTSFYPAATLEASTLANEQLYYHIPDDASTRVDKSTVPGYPTDTYTSPNDFIHRLNGNGTKVGSSIVLKVMSGDRFTIHAKSWYRLNGVSPGNPVDPISELIASLAGGVTRSVSGKYVSADLIGSGILSPGVTSMLNSQVYTTTKPKAFVNWVLFDEQFKFVGSSSGIDQVGADQEFKTHILGDLPITKNGYLYIYVSNETPNVDVFFDNLQVTHIHGPLLEETHYYPFGLTMAGISSKAAGKLQNKYKFNGGNELQNGEFSDGSGLEMYDAVHRMYDPQLGRFFQIDKLSELSIDFTPYGFARNNPIRMNDPLGLKEDTVTGTSPEVVVRSSRKEIASKAMNKYDYGQITGWIDAKRKQGNSIETIQNWALNNPYLSEDALDRIMAATSGTALAIRDAKAEAWELEGKIFAALLATITGTELLALVEAEAVGVAAGRGVASITSKTKDVLKAIDNLIRETSITANFEVRMGLSKVMKNAPDLAKIAKTAEKLYKNKALKEVVKAIANEIKKAF